MGFTLDDIVIDRVQYGFAEDLSGNPLYALTQLQDATINISAESTDATDNQGNLVKRFWKAKTGEFTANNAMINLNVIGAASGEGKQIASSTNKIVMPKIVVIDAGAKEVDLPGAVEGSLKVNAFSTNGSMGDSYTKSEAASATAYAFTEAKKFTPPSAADVKQYIVKYDREVESGVAITNRADKFPQTVKLTLKALAVDPCHSDVLRGVYIVLPSFQVSPEIEISLTTDGQLAYSGSLQVDYCSNDKALYHIYWADDDED